MKSPIFYSGQNRIRKALDSLGVYWREKEVKSEFWGIRFEVDKPRGKDSRKKIKAVQELFGI